jgi:hypothetical protein
LRHLYLIAFRINKTFGDLGQLYRRDYPISTR